jgi:mRNA interferase YafQ
MTRDWGRYRDCHIEPDWLLLYKNDGNDLILARTGTHADLFR